MNNDFKSYILNKLNEADGEQKPKSKLPFDENKGIVTEPEENKFTQWLKNNIKNVKLEKNKETGNEQLYYYPDPKNKNKKTALNAKNVKYDIISAYNKIKNGKNKDFFDKNEDGIISTIDESKFETLGKTIGYRSALALLKNGDDFRAAVKDVISDESNMSIKNLEDIYEYFGLAAAVKTINDEKKRDKSNKEAIKSLNELLQQLSNVYTRNKAIDSIKNRFGQQYDKNVGKYKNSFDKGLKDIREKMAKADFEWKDPATGEPPKGFKGKATKILSQGVAKLGQLGENLYKKIPSQHNLENDMARLVCFGVRALLKGVGAIANLIRGLSDAAKMRKIWSNKKLSDVESEIDKFLKEFNEWKKKQSEQPKEEQQQKEEQTATVENSSLQQIFKNILNEAEENNERKEILTKFNDLMYNHILPYYCYKLSNVSYSFENKDNLFIVEYVDNKWSTDNTANDKLTIIEDNAKLILKYFNIIKNKLVPVLNEFKNESAKDGFRGWTNLDFNSNISSEFEKFLKNFDPELPLKKFLEIYNADVIVNREKFKTYNDYIKYVNDVEPKIEACNGIKPLNRTTLTLADGVDIDTLKTSIKGILIPTNKSFNDKEFKDILDSMNAEDDKIKYTFRDEVHTITDDKDETKKDITNYRLAKTYEKNTKLYDTWVKENKGSKKDVIELLNNYFGVKNTEETDEEENEENTIDSTEVKNFEEYTIRLSKELDKIDKNIQDENILNKVKKLKEEIKTDDNQIKKFMEENEAVESTYMDFVNRLKGAEYQIIPAIWIKRQILYALKKKNETKTETWKIDRFLQLLTEDENVVNDINSKINKLLNEDIESLYELKTSDEFKQKYSEWIKSVKEVSEKIKSLNNEEVNKKLDEYKDKDPYILACLCAYSTNKVIS